MTQLMLQRKRIGDTGKWRTVCAFTEADAPKVQRAAEAISEVDTVAWRVVMREHPYSEIAYFDGRQWREPVEQQR